jgi:quercetin dioxygenase-like cupin family protein
MDNSEVKNTILNPDRRSFLFTASAATAAGLTLGDTRLFAAPVQGQGDSATGPGKIQMFTNETLNADIATMQTAPGNNTIVNDKTVSIILTVEKAKSAKEFEWHEGRDHVIYILDGATKYEVGGTPKGGHSTGPGEWLAPESEGALVYNMKKGDLLVFPRGTPHKRSTADSVVLTITSSITPAKA